MALLEQRSLEGLTWKPGKQARLWLAQPQLSVTDTPPYICQPNGTAASGFSLLKAILVEEEKHEEPLDAPSFIVLPEFAIRPDEIEDVRLLIGAARRNTVIIFGVGHIVEAQARTIEASDLWLGPSYDKCTNCAGIGVGGSDRLHLQPKIVPSGPEKDYLWKGKKILYFVGNAVQFTVVICSELLDQPGGDTTLSQLVREVRDRNLTLNLIFWLQHNKDPRSAEFNKSLASLTAIQPQPTVLVISSRQHRPDRLKNYAVSGAIVPHSALSPRFQDLDGRFRYIEPIADDPSSYPMSRLVLLRYDADVHYITTALADDLAPGGKTATNAYFEQSLPFKTQSGALSASTANFHIEDILSRALKVANASAPTLAKEHATIVERLVSAGTADFLGFLDVAVLPQPPLGAKTRHAAGQHHSGGDYLCTCWRHRRCLDGLTDGDTAAGPVANVLRAAGALLSQKVDVYPAYDRGSRTNMKLKLGSIEYPFGIVDPLSLDAEGAQRGLWAGSETSLVYSPYVILGVSTRPTRPLVAEVEAAQAGPGSGLDAGVAAGSHFKAVFEDKFWKFFDESRLKELIEDLVVRTE